MNSIEIPSPLVKNEQIVLVACWLGGSIAIWFFTERLSASIAFLFLGCGISESIVLMTWQLVIIARQIDLLTEAVTKLKER